MTLALKLEEVREAAWEGGRMENILNTVKALIEDGEPDEKILRICRNSPEDMVWEAIQKVRNET